MCAVVLGLSFMEAAYREVHLGRMSRANTVESELQLLSPWSAVFACT